MKIQVRYEEKKTDEEHLNKCLEMEQREKGVLGLEQNVSETGECVKTLGIRWSRLRWLGA